MEATSAVAEEEGQVVCEWELEGFYVGLELDRSKVLF